MNWNAKKIGMWVVTGLAVALTLFSGFMKFMGFSDVEATLAKTGVTDYRLLLGSMEVVFGLLFLYPKTLRIGFILLTCYFAGALATELSHAMPLNALPLLILIWVAAFLRDRDLFLPVQA